MTAPALSRAARIDTSTLESRVAHEQRALRIKSVGAVALLVAGLVAVAGALGAFAFDGGRWMAVPAPVPVAVWLIVAAAAAALVTRTRRRDRALLSVPSLARAIESEQQLRAGSLQGALEVGRSGVLGARAAHDVARRLTPAVLVPQLSGRLVRGLAIAGAGALVGAAALAIASRRTPDGLAAMLHPVRAWRGLLLPALAFERLPSSVPRGMPLTVRIRAEGRQVVTVSRRAAGEAWHDTTLTVSPSEGVALLALGPVRAPITLRVGDGRAPVAQATVAVADRGWIGDVSLFAQYPAYLLRANENLEPAPPFRVPRGTRVRVTATLRGGARDALLTDGRDTVRLQAEGATAAADNGVIAVTAVLPVDHDGQWEWVALAAPHGDGSVANLSPELPDPLPFTVVPDRAPDVLIRAPTSDTTIGARGVVPIVVQAGDDHGVGNVALTVWRESATPGPVLRERVEVADPASPIFIGGATIALDGRDLQPGDKIHVVAVATDDSPWRQQTQSAELVLRVPSLTEQRSLARSLADSLAARAAQIAADEKKLAQNTNDASRSRDLKSGSKNDGAQSNGAPKPPGKDGNMSFSAAEKAKQLARDQQKLGSRVDSLRASAKELEERLKSAGALDTALAARMRDVQKMLRDAMTPEMQKQLAALEKSTERLSGTEAQQSMEQLAAQQRQMRDQLEKSAEMLKRAALEGAMGTLRDDAKDLAKAEKQLADKLDSKKGTAGNKSAGGKSSPDAMDPKMLAEQSKALEQEIERLTKRLSEAGAKPGASKTKAAQPLANQATESMQRAAKQAADEAAREKAGSKGDDALAKALEALKNENDKNAQAGEAKKADEQQGAGSQAQAANAERKPGAQKPGANDGPKSASAQGPAKDDPQGKPGGEKGGEQGGEKGGGSPGGNGAGEARKAADAMDKAAQQLSAARDAQVDAWKTELSQDLDQSINETMQLARQQQSLEQRARQQGANAQGMQGEQGAVQQGVQQAAERLEKAGRSSSLLSQRSQKAMADAQRRVEQATQQMGQASQPGGSEATQSAMKDAAEALNQALSSLVRDREKVNNAQSASGFTEMMEQLKQLAQQQGTLNGQMQGLNLMPGGAKGQQAQQQSRALARQQRDVAKTLADVSDADATGRTDALAKEAALLAQQLERNGVDPSVAARQQQLYRRLLDAGRFLEQDEKDDQGPREAKAASGASARGVVEGPQSGKAGNKFVPPTWNELRGLGPEERRLVIEYFRRLNGSP